MTSAASLEATMTLPSPKSRAELLTLLAEACELEHGLACSYLYAAFSLKQDASEGGLTPEQVMLTRQWAGQIFFVAAQEMLHLAQAWNLLVAAGGAPYYLRPNFPQASKFYPLHIPLSLTPFSVDTLSRFVAYEKPEEISEDNARVLSSLTALRPRSENQVTFHSIAELYGRIQEGFEQLPDIFVADPARQTGTDTADFPDLVPVVDLESARRAIARIRSQGEGVASDRLDCHFGMFMAILNTVLDLQRQHKAFEPARAAEANPTVLPTGSSGAPAATPIKHPFSRDVAMLFDDIYGLMLRMLSYAFSASGKSAQVLGKQAIRLMPTVVKPLGEALMLLPSDLPSDKRRAGPGFGLTRHVLFPDDPSVATKLSCEWLLELAKTCDKLAEKSEAPRHLKDIGGRLRLAQNSMKHSL
jgi:Ferritin-like